MGELELEHSSSGWPDELLDVYRAEYEGFVRLAYLLVGSTSLAEEIVQDAFVAVHPRWAEVRSSPGGYVRTAVLNGAKTTLRRRDVERRHAPDPPPPGATDDLVELRDAVLRLDWPKRVAVILRYWADLPDDVTAEVLGCRPATVRSHLARGVARLREELAP